MIPLPTMLVLISIGSCLSTAQASPSDCESIADPDQRHYCRAVSGGHPSECESIRSLQLRSMCRAMTKGR